MTSDVCLEEQETIVCPLAIALSLCHFDRFRAAKSHRTVSDPATGYRTGVNSWEAYLE
jgi:hypothetical protein